MAVSVPNFRHTISLMRKSFGKSLSFLLSAFLFAKSFQSANAEILTVNCSSGGNFSIVKSSGAVTSQSNCGGTAQFPEYTKIIAAEVFMNARSLTSVRFNEGLTVIGSHSFAASGLTSIELPSTITKIDSFAFGYLSKVTSVSFPSSLLSIGSGAFYGTSLTSIYRSPSRKLVALLLRFRH